MNTVNSCLINASTAERLFGPDGIDVISSYVLCLTMLFSPKGEFRPHCPRRTCVYLRLLEQNALPEQKLQIVYTVAVCTAKRTNFPTKRIPQDSQLKLRHSAVEVRRER